MLKFKTKYTRLTRAILYGDIDIHRIFSKLDVFLLFSNKLLRTHFSRKKVATSHG